jgi:hypothetical protein
MKSGSNTNGGRWLLVSKACSAMAKRTCSRMSPSISGAGEVDTVQHFGQLSPWAGSSVSRHSMCPTSCRQAPGGVDAAPRARNRNQGRGHWRLGAPLLQKKPSPAGRRGARMRLYDDEAAVVGRATTSATDAQRHQGSRVSSLGWVWASNTPR